MLVEKTVGGLHSYLSDVLMDALETKDSSILDIGCGSGAWLCRAKDVGFGRLVGLDYEQPAAIAGLELLRFDLNAGGQAELGRFDVVTCIEVIEHLENVGRLLDLIKLSLARDGVAIVTSPNIESLRARIRFLATGKVPSFDEKGDPTHLFPLLRESLCKMLTRRGLTIVRVIQYPEVSSETLIFGRSVRLLSRVLRPCFRDTLYGDTNIFVIMHAETV